MKKLYIKAVLGVCILFGIGYPVEAHTLWINFTEYMPLLNEGKSKTTMYMGWGHHFPVDSYVNIADFDQIVILKPDGSPEETFLETSGIGAKRMVLKQSGIYNISVIRRAAYNTAYLDEGEVKTVKKSRVGVKNVISSTYSQQFAKSIVYTGGENTDGLSHIWGHKLEIIPLSNPYHLDNTGGIMQVKILFEGKPVPFQKVFASYAGYDTGDMAACSSSTDRHGIARIRISHWGPWVIKTKVERWPVGTMKNKVNQENYFASLTFSVP